MRQSESNLILNRFNGIFEDGLIQRMIETCRVEQFEKDALLIDIGDTILYLPLIVSGSLKILTEDEEGRELLMYYLENGDTCAITINCCTTKTKSKVRAVVEQDVVAIFIPLDRFDVWMANYATWRSFILETFNQRINELLEAFDNLAFNNLEERLTKYLRDKAMVIGSMSISCTHLEIANDLHSSRVVVSRLLKKLELDGKISQKRNTVKLLKI